MSVVMRSVLGLAVCIASACGTNPATSTKTEPQLAPAPPTKPPPAEEKLEVRTEKYANGQLQSKGEVSVRGGEDIQVGVWTYWFEDGSKAAEIGYKDGKEEGPMRMWHPNGKEKMSATLKNGKPSGTAILWYENGNKERTEHYKDGLNHGSMESWYENGQIANRHNMALGKAEGADQGWYPSGKDMFSKIFKDGLAEGKAAAWYENGNRRWEFTFSKGQLHGSYTRWYRDGQIWFEGNYASGQRDGSWKAHHHNRAPLLEATYAAGKLVSQRCWSNKRKKRQCADDETSKLRGDYESDPDQPKGDREQFGEIYLMHLSEQKDRLCTCSDDACVQKVSDFMDKFAFEFQGLRPSPAAGNQLTSIGREITACRAALGSEYRGRYKQ